MRRRTLQIAFSPTDPRCHGNEIWNKIGYKLACVRDFCEIFFASVGEFSEMGHQMLLTEFYPDRTLVAMATKFKTKWAIPRLVQQISPGSLHLTEVRVESLAIDDVSRSLPQSTLISRYNEQHRL